MTSSLHNKNPFESQPAPPLSGGENLDQRIAWLRGVHLFSGIKDDPKAMEHIAAMMEFRQYHSGQEILREGAEGYEAYFLMEGQVRVQKSISDGESFPVAVLESGSHPFFGEAALLASDRRTATIVSETPCACLVLRKHKFDLFAAENPQWALPLVMSISRVLIDRLHRANNDVVLLYNALVREVRGESA